MWLKRLKESPETAFCTVATETGPIMVPYLIRRSRKSRRIYVSVDSQNRVLLTIPQRGTIKAAMQFLSQCGDWVVEQMANTPKPQTLLEFLQKKPYLTLLGKRMRVVFGYTNRCPYYQLKRDTEEVILHYDPYHIHELRIREALKSLAKLCLTERLHWLCEKKSIRPPKRITVRNQSSIWGSCSANRSISLNWRLILLPPVLQDYVILHELAHLKEMNHSPRFWKLLQSYDSRSQAHDRKLNELSRRVFAIGQVNETT